MPSSINVAGYNGTINDLTVNGNLTLTGSFTMNTKYCSLASSTSLTVPATTDTTVVFDVSQANTMGTDLTITGNNTFTYSGTGNKLWKVTYGCRTGDLPGTSSAGNTFNIWIRKNGGSTFYGQQLVSCNTACALTGSATIPMTTGDYINCFVWASQPCTISTTGSLTRVSILSIIQL